VLDRGLWLGDGLFETLGVFNKDPKRLKGHLERLRQSLKKVKIHANAFVNQCPRVIQNLISKNNIINGVVRIIVTRGSAVYPSLGLNFKKLKPTCFVSVYPFLGYPDKNYEKGISIEIRPAIPYGAIKHIGTMSQLMLRMNSHTQYDETIGINAQGILLEGATSNLFFIKRKAVYTPTLALGILPGVVRGFVLSWARHRGYQIKEGSYQPERLLSADEVFITSSVRGVMPVRRVGRKLCPFSTRISGRIQSAYLNS